MSDQKTLKFWKYSGLGNKIILIDLVRQPGEISSNDVARLASDSKVEFDQLITIEPPEFPELDFSAEIFNRDGSKAENCINGARCFGKHVFDSGLLRKEELFVGVGINQWKIKELGEKIYSVEQEVKDLDYGITSLPNTNPSGLHDLEIDGKIFEIGFINLGNPHAINFNKDIKDMPLETLGVSIQKSKSFPEGVNLTLAEIKSPEEVYIRVFERGVGETLACGSGACATVIKGFQLGYLRPEVQVNFKQGHLSIKYDDIENSLVAKGPADFIEEIDITL
tara:strand:+ start:1758 stop:2597 length:840 start_codon:yes stop_codon:yes gene_type:complete